MTRLHGLVRPAMLAIALSLSGCCHDLQGPFVKSMEDTMIAIELDVEAGIYKPDAHGQRTLHRMKTAITDARAVLDSDKAE